MNSRNEECRLLSLNLELLVFTSKFSSTFALMKANEVTVGKQKEVKEEMLISKVERFEFEVFHLERKKLSYSKHSKKLLLFEWCR